MNTPVIVIFDGVCNFCNYWVNFAIRHNKKQNLLFTPLQGKTAGDLSASHGIDLSSADSVIVVAGEKVYKLSSAVLEISRHLGGGWKLLYGLKIIPAFIRDPLYRVVARNRYKWFGKKDSCMIPSEQVRRRFLD